MAKKIIIILVMAVFFAGFAFAGTDPVERPALAQNRVGFSVGMLGAEVSYERVLSEHFSVLGQVSYNTWILADSLSFTGKGRVYPFGGAFFLEIGAGYSYGYNIADQVADFMLDLVLGIMTFGLWFLTDDFQNKEYGPDSNHFQGGISVQPALGWNIDIGGRDGFRMPISLGLDVRVGDPLTVLPFFRMGLTYAF